MIPGPDLNTIFLTRTMMPVSFWNAVKEAKWPPAEFTRLDRGLVESGCPVFPGRNASRGLPNIGD